jgi:hypothetical protein
MWCNSLLSVLAGGFIFEVLSLVVFLLSCLMRRAFSRGTILAIVNVVALCCR